MNKKILNLSQIKKKIFKLKINNKKITLCHGVLITFIQDINYERSKNNHYLIVSITTDKYVNKIQVGLYLITIKELFLSVNCDYVIQ